MTDVTYTVQIWSNTTKKWRDARCRQSTVSNSCVVTNLNTRITITDLIPGHAYYVRVTSSPFQVFTQVPLGMETKQLGNYKVITSYSNYKTIQQRFIRQMDALKVHLCIHVYKDLMRCKSVCDVKSRKDPRPFWLTRVPNDAHIFVSFEAYKKPTFGNKEPPPQKKRRNAFLGRCKDVF